jgi:phosphatidylinositol glycan class S
MFLYNSTIGMRLTSLAFIIPQWRGIISFNQGDQHLPHNTAEISSILRSQLLIQLGVESLPTGVELAEREAGEVSPSSPLSEWQIDALLRWRMRRNVEGVSQTLGSIISLVKKLENMLVGMDVKGDVFRAPEELESVRYSS